MQRGICNSNVSVFSLVFFGVFYVDFLKCSLRKKHYASPKRCFKCKLNEVFVFFFSFWCSFPRFETADFRFFIFWPNDAVGKFQFRFQDFDPGPSETSRSDGVQVPV